MQELLEKLLELDRETWESIARGIPISPSGKYFTFDNGETLSHRYQDSYMPLHSLLPEVAFAWMQACIQRAIEAKGWFWRLEAKPYQAIIYDDDGEKIFKEGDSAASALLAAYLQALEANHVQSR